MTFTKVCDLAAVRDGDIGSFYVEGVDVIVLRDRTGELRALDGICPHEDYPLSEGDFDGATLTCLAHGWVFNATSGQGINPANCKLSSYAIKVEGDDVLVDVYSELD